MLDAIKNPEINYLYRTNQANFEKISGRPIAYWASMNLIQDFEIETPLENIVTPKQGLATAENKRVLRLWYEVDDAQIYYHAHSINESVLSEKKWFPYNKGGSFRKWYGNYDYVVNWKNDGYEIRNFKWSNGKLRSVTRNPQYYFHEAITWSDVTSGDFSARYRNFGSIFDVVGKSAFSTQGEDDLFQLLGLLNTKVTNYIFKILNPTIHLQTGNFSNFPVLTNSKSDIKSVKKIIDISKKDWNEFEISWDFKAHPLLTHIADDNLLIWYYSLVHTNTSAKNVPTFQLWGLK